MHLCHPCRAERDWETDASVNWQIKQNAAKPPSDPLKARCCECTQLGDPPTPTFIRNPFFQICKRCAERLNECQRCRKPTLPEQELERREWRETLLDLFTLSMKSCGRAATQEAFRRQAGELGIEAVEEVISAAGSVHLDGRVDRAVWRRVLGCNIYRHPRWCNDCQPPSRRPALCRAERCGHLTIGSAAAWCALCATEERSCETCGASFE